jgi:hypothetical protein
MMRDRLDELISSAVGSFLREFPLASQGFELELPLFPPAR